VLAINRATGEIRSGQIGGLDGYDYCILKFGDSQYCSAELEMTYYEMATKAGIKMMPSELLNIEGKWHFQTMRFDRKGTEKIHTQTLAAINPEADSYEALLQTCRRLHLPESDCVEVFRRMVFNHLANNTDDHNKNFSFTMNHQGEWRLAPAYDITYIIDVGGYQPNRDHCIFTCAKLRDITLHDVLEFAVQNGISKPESVIEEVVASLRQFREIAKRNHVAEEWIGRVETCLQRHLSEWGFGEAITSVCFTLENGITVENAHLEQAYKGNIHLLATIGGEERKFVIRRKTALHNQLTAIGLSNVSKEQLQQLTLDVFGGK
ncbi:MAG: HipA domain-containing protein, partial [Bacteroidales bacterium]|nr:HipA domain-containing protein [Bacteroidales bacterium]